MSLIPTLRGSLLTLTLLSALSAEATELQHWPEPQAAKLNKLIQLHANQGEFAVFDLDNTTYQNDLEEALIPWLERRQLLTRDSMPSSLKLIPFDDRPGTPESLYSYYHRLCEQDELICYPWAAQIFAGFSIAELRGFVAVMLKEQKPIPVVKMHHDRPQPGEVSPPKLLTGMQELFSKLRENGIRVYIISAAHEELARIVASDPQYGYNVPPQDVLGINTLLRNPASGELTTSRRQIREGVWQPGGNDKLVLTPYLVSPMTWYEGKAATILAYIDQWRKPVLVGGDTLYSDTFMLLNSTNVAQDGLRLWVNRSEETRNRLKLFLRQVVSGQKAAGTTPDGEKNWVIVQQSELQ